MHNNPSRDNGKTIKVPKRALNGSIDSGWTQMISIGSIDIGLAKPVKTEENWKKLDGATDRNRTCIASFGGSYPIRWKTVATQICER